MLNQYIANPGVPGLCVHNTRQWQVTKLMGGLAAELLYKERVLDASAQAEGKLSLHECYPSLFFQGDDADEFLGELQKAQARNSPAQVDKLMLSAYSGLV